MNAAMKKLRIALALALSLALDPAPAAAGTSWKVTERSAKSAPEWVGTHSSTYLVVEVERPNIQEARAAAEQELARSIISAVAVSVTTESQSGGSEIMEGDRRTSTEYFTTKTKTAAARLPFMKGVSLANAQDTYWEKREDKKTKKSYVVFSVKYPLSQRELEDMRKQFEELDATKTAEFNTLKEGLEKVDSSTGIQQAIASLQSLQEFFFDSNRLAEAAGLEKSYRALYKGITLKTNLDKQRKEATVDVLLNGRPFKCTATPKATSECATVTTLSHSDDGTGYTIGYDDSYCLEGEENFIDFQLRVEGTRLSAKIHL